MTAGTNMAETALTVFPTTQRKIKDVSNISSKKTQ